MKKKWSWEFIILWSVVALLIPIGLIIGPVNLKYDERRSQAILLLGTSLVSLLLWTIHFTGMH